MFYGTLSGRYIVGEIEGLRQGGGLTSLGAPLRGQEGPPRVPGMGRGRGGGRGDEKGGGHGGGCAPSSVLRSTGEVLVVCSIFQQSRKDIFPPGSVRCSADKTIRKWKQVREGDAEEMGAPLLEDHNFPYLRSSVPSELSLLW